MAALAFPPICAVMNRHRRQSVLSLSPAGRRLAGAEARFEAHLQAAARADDGGRSRGCAVAGRLGGGAQYRSERRGAAPSDDGGGRSSGGGAGGETLRPQATE